MADNFDLKKYLVENKLGPFAKVKVIDEGTVVISSDDKFTTTIDGKEYRALYDNHDEGDHIELQQIGDSKNIKSGTVKKVSEDGDLTIELDPTNDYTEKRKSLEETITEKATYAVNEEESDIERELGWKGLQDPEYLASKGWTSKKGPGIPKRDVQTSIVAGDSKSGTRLNSPTALWSYANKRNVDLHKMATEDPAVKDVDSFLKKAIDTVEGFSTYKNTDQLKRHLTAYYNMVKPTRK